MAIEPIISSHFIGEIPVPGRFTVKLFFVKVAGPLKAVFPKSSDFYFTIGCSVPFFCAKGVFSHCKFGRVERVSKAWRRKRRRAGSLRLWNGIRLYKRKFMRFGKRSEHQRSGTVVSVLGS